jgi:hypothetical protein
MERLLSLYHYKKRKGGVGRHTFNQWARSLSASTYGRIPNMRWTHEHRKGVIYDRKLVTFVVPFERLHDGVNDVLKHVGAPVLKTIPKKEATKHVPFREAYTPQLWTTAANWFQPDIQLGYDLSWQSDND